VSLVKKVVILEETFTDLLLKDDEESGGDGLKD